MARNRYKILETEYPYFITCTAIYWLPLFKTVFAKQTIIESLIYLQKEKGLKIFAYTLMHNHIHLIISSKNTKKHIANFKSYTARRIIDYFIRKNNLTILHELEYANPVYKTDRKYKFWQAGYHPKQIMSLKIFQQKIDYIHLNPVRKGYVDSPEEWQWSSANPDGQIILDPIID